MSVIFTLAYIKHQLISKNRHGTHSPFVYRLADEVIYDFSLKKVYNDVAVYRKELLNDHSNKYLYSLKNKFKKPKLLQLIIRLATNHTPCTMVELGTDVGLTSCCLAKSCPNTTLFIIEENPAIADINNKYLAYLRLNNIEIINGNILDELPKVISTAKNLDFVYFHASENKEACLNYFNFCLPYINENTLFLFEDINKSVEMKKAWAKIKNHPQVTITIDLFWLGLVYFKKGQAKEHFRLKF